MKKILALLLAILMLLSLAACSASNKEDGDKPNDGTTVEMTPDTTTLPPATTLPPETTLPEQPPQPDAAEVKIAKYVEDNKADLLSAFESSFATSSGLTCSSTIVAEGRGFIIRININELENVPAETKKVMQDTYDSMNDTFVSSLKMMQTELPELEYYEICVCDKNGDVLAVVRAEEGAAEDTPDTAEAKIAKYVQDHEADLIAAFEGSFSGSGMTCSSTIKAEGRGFIICVNINELENLSAEDKKLLQDTYDSMNDTFVSALETMQTELPELEYYEIRVCDKNGDVLAVVRAEEGGDAQDAAEVKIAKYVEDNKADLLSAFESSFATSSGMTCTSSIKAEGRGFVIRININELENVPAETKKLLQDTYDSMNDAFVTSLETMQTELPELEYFAVEVCDKNGDVLAVIRAEN